MGVAGGSRWVGNQKGRKGGDKCIGGVKWRQSITKLGHR